MVSGRLLFLIIASIIAVTIPSSAMAGWFFSDTSDWDKSGLDIESGYDVNTVVNIRGKISDVKTSSGEDSSPAMADMISGGETVTLILGPKSFWKDHGTDIKKGDELEVRGSKAQGKDGKIYLFAQSLTIPSENRTIVLRSETGRPAWSGKGGAGPDRSRSTPMRRFRGGRNH